MSKLFDPENYDVLIGCEHSGAIRDAMIAQGIRAISCDLLSSDTDGPHYQGDLRDLLNHPWPLLIAHPDCTFLTGAAAWALKDPDFDRYPGVGYHQRVKPGTLTGKARRVARRDAGEFAALIWSSPAKRIAIENPRGGLSAYIKGGELQEVQPHQFGDDASKATIFRTRGLPRLTHTQHIAPRLVEGKPRWSNQTDAGQNRLSPGPDRWKERSKTYPGIANAIAAQWGIKFIAPKPTPTFPFSRRPVGWISAPHLSSHGADQLAEVEHHTAPSAHFIQRGDA